MLKVLRGEMPFRVWVQGQQEKDAGAWGRDEIRNIQGRANLFRIGSLEIGHSPTSGAFALVEDVQSGVLDLINDGTYKLYGNLSFSAANAVPTGPQNVPQHIWTPYIIYLGLTV